MVGSLIDDSPFRMVDRDYKRVRIKKGALGKIRLRITIPEYSLSICLSQYFLSFISSNFQDKYK